MRWTLLVGLGLGLVACSDRAERGDQLANEMIAFSKANPDVSDEFWKTKGTLTCRPEARKICGPKGCSEGTSQVVLHLSPAEGTYERCGDEGCDKYRAVVTHSGIWTTIAVPDHAIMARVAGGGRYVETLAQWDSIYVHHGQCQSER